MLHTSDNGEERSDAVMAEAQGIASVKILSPALIEMLGEINSTDRMNLGEFDLYLGTIADFRGIPLIGYAQKAELIKNAQEWDRSRKVARFHHLRSGRDHFFDLLTGTRIH